MKVVIFCGGLGMRLREFTENTPKPMVPIGYLPVLWHVMKYYAHFGHKDFILCLGYRAEDIVQCFSPSGECPESYRRLPKVNGNMEQGLGGLHRARSNLELFESDIREWNVTFVDSGIHSNIGQRLKAAEPHLEGAEVFLANYADGLVDLPLPKLLQFAEGHGKIATFVSAKPNLSYHVTSAEPDGVVTGIHPIRDSGLRINTGFFVFRRDIFGYMRDGEDLVYEPFNRLIQERQLMAYRHDGFYACMDTFKEKQELDDMYARGGAPWVLWESAAAAG
jgi:glucose-1-phosphate cytidylyltransferase